MSKEYVLLTDFGSTFTKQVLVETSGEVILAVAKSETTVKEGLGLGFEKALKEIEAKSGVGYDMFHKKHACSSAAGGLKIVAIGLVEELTGKAAKLAALGAGGKVTAVYAGNLSNRDVTEIIEAKPDLIILAGGIDGGDSKNILYNAGLLAPQIKGIPVVVAGNKSASDELRLIFNGHKINYMVSENVLPKLNKLDVDSARACIKEMFVKHIVNGKGLAAMQNRMDSDIIPTPVAVLRAATLFAEGTQLENGVGDLMIVDVGGATTDIHTICDGLPQKNSVIYQGLIEPREKRTVEGDLGMRVSALHVYEAAGMYEFNETYGHYSPMKSEIPRDLYERCKDRTRDTDFLATSQVEVIIDLTLATLAIKHGIKRHAGELTETYSPIGKVYLQKGKDLTNLDHVICTGGVLVNNKDNKGLMDKAIEYKNGLLLTPRAINTYTDRDYIISAMGLLSDYYPEMSLRMMKKHIL